MASYANPQSLNRYSYVTNNPLRYTDPTGHMQAADQDVSRNKASMNCSKYSQYCNNGKPKSANELAKMRNSTNDSCNNVTCKALSGDTASIADLLIPTHGGVRVQLELSFLIFSISGGANAVYNRVDTRLGGSFDFTGEVSPGLSLGAGASLTGGALIGWGSSSVKDVISGNSVVVSGAAAYEGAVTGAVSAPIEGPLTAPQGLHIDPHYGQVPATMFLGGGLGGAYAGLSGGLTHNLLSGSGIIP